MCLFSGCVCRIAVTLRWLNETNIVSEDIGDVLLCASLNGTLAVPLNVDVVLDPGRATPNEGKTRGLVKGLHHRKLKFIDWFIVQGLRHRKLV